MKRILIVAIAAAMLSSITAQDAFAHGGGLDDRGCHRETATGGYHCHRPQGGDDNGDWETIGAVIGGALVLWLVIEVVKTTRHSLYTPQLAPLINEDGTSQIKAYWKLRF